MPTFRPTTFRSNEPIHINDGVNGMTKSEAIDKIRKLLSTKGRTDAEADTANILAACIAEKHGIDISELDRAEQDRATQITHQSFGQWAVVPDEATYASLICKRFFEVSPFKRTSFYSAEMVVVGTEHHLTIARYVFDFLIGEFRRAWNRRANKRIKKRKAFLHAAWQAIYCKLHERFETKQSPQLELALEINFKAKREQYIKEHFGDLTSSELGPKKKSNAAAMQGWRAGNSIDIRDGVNDGRHPAGALGTGPKLLTQ